MSPIFENRLITLTCNVHSDLAGREFASEHGDDSMIRFRVNGVERSFDGDPEMPVLWYLRDILGLTGTKFGCGAGL